MNSSSIDQIAVRLNCLLAEEGQHGLPDDSALQFGRFFDLLVRWNARTNLTAIRDEDGILRRHFLECIITARSLPPAIGHLLDLGSGAGFPGVPIALCRPDIRVFLAESQNKKAAFLNEVVRTLGLGCKVHSNRAETLGRKFDCVTLRAVDRMHDAIVSAAGLLRDSGLLAIITTLGEVERIRDIPGNAIAWQVPQVIAAGTDRVLLTGRYGG